MIEQNESTIHQQLSGYHLLNIIYSPSSKVLFQQPASFQSDDLPSNLYNPFRYFSSKTQHQRTYFIHPQIVQPMIRSTILYTDQLGGVVSNVYALYITKQLLIKKNIFLLLIKLEHIEIKRYASFNPIIFVFITIKSEVERKYLDIKCQNMKIAF